MKATPNKAAIVTDTIERFTSYGIQLTSGQELAAGIIVTATGLKLNALGDVAISKDGVAYERNKAHFCIPLPPAPSHGSPQLSRGLSQI